MIDFNKRLTPEQKERARLRKEDEERRTVNTISASDTEGNLFKKTAILSEDLKVISLGWPVEYDLDDLVKSVDKSNCTEFCIDFGGRNHKGFKTSMVMVQVRALLIKAMALRNSLKSYYSNG